MVMKKSKSNTRRITNAKATLRESSNGARFAEAADCLAEIGRGFHARGWVLGTSGNFSAVISCEPLRLAITSTGLDKGSLSPAQFLEMDEAANVVRGDGRPSAEALLHLPISAEYFRNDRPFAQSGRALPPESDRSIPRYFAPHSA
jgi:hypothetical protein